MRNKFEKKIYEELKKLVPVSYESEKLPYTLECLYIPDFIFKTKSSGKKIYLETKGHFRVEDKRKLAAIKKQYPELDLRIIFYSIVHKNSKWANKHKIHYAIRDIPEEWLNE